MKKYSRRRKQAIKLNLSEYAEYLSEEPDKYSILPKPLIASIFGKSQAWVTKNISDGVFDIIELVDSEDRRVGKYVIQQSVLEFKKKLEDEEEDFISRIKNILIKCAKIRGGGGIYYSELMEKVGLSYKVPSDRLRIGVLLGKVSKITYENSGVMLSALAVSKRDKMPAEFFFELADDLEHESYDDYDTDKEFYEAECKKIYSLAEKGKLK